MKTKSQFIEEMAMPRQSQFDPVVSGTPPEPELKLMAMILEDAIACYLRYRDAKSAVGRRERQAAERWLFSRDRRWIFSFENICNHLGADPEFVRGQIRARRLKGSLGRHRSAIEGGENSARQSD
jgi:hypothetical protein